MNLPALIAQGYHKLVFTREEVIEFSPPFANQFEESAPMSLSWFVARGYFGLHWLAVGKINDQDAPAFVGNAERDGAWCCCDCISFTDQFNCR